MNTCYCKYYFFVVLSICFLNCYASTQDSISTSSIVIEKTEKTRVESFRDNIEGKNVCWDFSNIKITDDKKTMTVMRDSASNRPFAIIEGNTIFYNENNSNELLLTKYENKDVKTVLLSPERYLSPPYIYQDSIVSFFSGYVCSSDGKYSLLIGKSKENVIGHGRLKLPDYYIDDVYKVSHEKELWELPLPHILTDRDMIIAHDSLVKFIDTDMLTPIGSTISNRWCAGTAEIPIIESKTVSTIYGTYNQSFLGKHIDIQTNVPAVLEENDISLRYDSGNKILKIKLTTLPSEDLAIGVFTVDGKKLFYERNAAHNGEYARNLNISNAHCSTVLVSVFYNSKVLTKVIAIK